MNKIPWWQPIIGKEEKKLMNSVLESNFPNEGRFTIEFENKIAKLLKVKHVVVVSNATSAMFLSLKAFGIGPGDEVIVPDITFIATANAVEMTGAKAVLVDVNENLTIDIEATRKAINKNTKAIIPVHVSGRAADLTKINKLAKENKLIVIEDAAEAFMSKHKNKFLGTIGVAGCFSLSPAKTITTGQGGFIATNDTKLYKKLIELKDQGRPVRGTGGDDIHFSVGFNFKFTDLQAAVGLGQLNYLDQRINRAKRNYVLYKKYLKDVKEVSLYPFDTKNGEVPQWVDIKVKNREKLNSFLEKNGIGYRNLWHPLHRQKPYKDSDKNFPNSTKFSYESLWLPSAFTLKDSDIKKVSELIIRFNENIE